MNRLEKKYRTKVIPVLLKQFNLKNSLAAPRLIKAVVNVGIGSGSRDEKIQQAVTGTIQRITGQKPIIKLAKKSISNFKIRKGMPIGLCVTMRKKRMYDFVDKLINVTLPRVRDFRGLERKSLDGQGNLNIGFKEHVVFPEIRPDEVESIHGLEVSVVTNASDNATALKLFELLGFPFKKE